MTMDEEKVTYSQSDLESKALNFIRRNKKKDIKTMSKAEIDEWVQLKARAARRYAENLMESGDPDFVAWPKAIRLEILESESD